MLKHFTNNAWKNTVFIAPLKWMGKYYHPDFTAKEFSAVMWQANLAFVSFKSVTG